MTDHRVYAVFGVSLTDPAKYGTRIFKDLLNHDYHVYALNPKGGTLLGQPVYKTLNEIPAQVYGAIVVVPAPAVQAVVAQCIAYGIQEIYFQPGARDPQAYRAAVNAGIEAVEDCFMAVHGIW